MSGRHLTSVAKYPIRIAAVSGLPGPHTLSGRSVSEIMVATNLPPTFYHPQGVYPAPVRNHSFR